MGTDNQNWHLNVSFDQWVAVPVPGPRPAARYKVLSMFRSLFRSLDFKETDLVFLLLSYLWLCNLKFFLAKSW